MRPPTHDDPNAIPRNGTDVPWVDLDERLSAPPPRGATEDGTPRSEQPDARPARRR